MLRHDQHGAAPLTAECEALDQPQQGQQERRGHRAVRSRAAGRSRRWRRPSSAGRAPAGSCGRSGHRSGRTRLHRSGGRRTRPRRCKAQQGADGRPRWGRTGREHDRRGHAVEEEVVPLDGRAGDTRADHPDDGAARWRRGRGHGISVVVEGYVWPVRLRASQPFRSVFGVHKRWKGYVFSVPASRRGTSCSARDSEPCWPGIVARNGSATERTTAAVPRAATTMSPIRSRTGVRDRPEPALVDGLLAGHHPGVRAERGPPGGQHVGGRTGVGVDQTGPRVAAEQRHPGAADPRRCRSRGIRFASTMPWSAVIASSASEGRCSVISSASRSTCASC